MQVVLIVEDDVLLRAQLSRALTRLPGVDVVEAGTVRESIDLAAGMDLDAVVTDLRLPDGTALELLPHLERDGARIPTVLISGNIDGYAGRLPQDLKVLEKPLQLNEIRDVVSGYLGRNTQAPPFALTDYLQLADLGRHSVQIEVSQNGEPTGIIVVRDGQPWTAYDELGDGRDAFLRLMTAADVDFECSPPAAIAETRTLEGSCEHLLLECARILDEVKAGRKPRTITRPLDGSVRPPALPPPPLPGLAAGTGGSAPGTRLDAAPSSGLTAAGSGANGARRVTPAGGTRIPSRVTPPIGTPIVARPSPTVPPVPRPSASAAPPPVPPARPSAPPLPAPPARPAEPARQARPAPARPAEPAPPAPPRSAPARSAEPPRPAPPARPKNDDAEFDRLYDAGIDALLGKRYREALELFTRARAIRSTPTLEANLNRLRAMGIT